MKAGLYHLPELPFRAADRQTQFVDDQMGRILLDGIFAERERHDLDHVVDAYRLLESSPPGKVLVMPQQHDA